MTPIVRPAVLALAALAQFAYFYRDYHGDYRHRSALWFERNRYGAFDRLAGALEANPSMAVYLPESPQWLYESWRLYLAQHDRRQWYALTRHFTPPHDVIPPDAAGVLPADLPEAVRSQSAPGHARTMITEEDGTAAFEVFVPTGNAAR